MNSQNDGEKMEVPKATAVEEANPASIKDLGPDMDHGEHIQEEKDRSQWASILAHPAAFFWAAYGAFQILLVSYENVASGIIIGIPQFRKDFGSAYDGNWVLDANWQAAFSAGPTGSSVFLPTPDLYIALRCFHFLKRHFADASI
jgi:hypothetical protein